MLICFECHCVLCITLYGILHYRWSCSTLISVLFSSVVFSFLLCDSRIYWKLSSISVPSMKFLLHFLKLLSSWLVCTSKVQNAMLWCWRLAWEGGLMPRMSLLLTWVWWPLLVSAVQCSVVQHCTASCLAHCLNYFFVYSYIYLFVYFYIFYLYGCMTSHHITFHGGRDGPYELSGGHAGGHSRAQGGHLQATHGSACGAQLSHECHDGEWWTDRLTDRLIDRQKDSCTAILID